MLSISIDIKSNYCAIFVFVQKNFVIDNASHRKVQFNPWGSVHGYRRAKEKWEKNHLNKFADWLHAIELNLKRASGKSSNELFGWTTRPNESLCSINQSYFERRLWFYLVRFENLYQNKLSCGCWKHQQNWKTSATQTDI